MRDHFLPPARDHSGWLGAFTRAACFGCKYVKCWGVIYGATNNSSGWWLRGSVVLCIEVGGLLRSCQVLGFRINLNGLLFELCTSSVFCLAFLSLVFSCDVCGFLSR